MAYRRIGPVQLQSLTQFASDSTLNQPTSSLPNSTFIGIVADKKESNHVYNYNPSARSESDSTAESALGGLVTLLITQPSETHHGANQQTFINVKLWPSHQTNIINSAHTARGVSASSTSASASASSSSSSSSPLSRSIPIGSLVLLRHFTIRRYRHTLTANSTSISRIDVLIQPNDIIDSTNTKRLLKDDARKCHYPGSTHPLLDDGSDSSSLSCSKRRKLDSSSRVSSSPIVFNVSLKNEISNWPDIKFFAQSMWHRQQAQSYGQLYQDNQVPTTTSALSYGHISTLTDGAIVNVIGQVRKYSILPVEPLNHQNRRKIVLLISPVPPSVACDLSSSLSGFFVASPFLDSHLIESSLGDRFIEVEIVSEHILPHELKHKPTGRMIQIHQLKASWHQPSEAFILKETRQTSQSRRRRSS